MSACLLLLIVKSCEYAKWMGAIPFRIEINGIPNGIAEERKSMSKESIDARGECVDTESVLCVNDGTSIVKINETDKLNGVIIFETVSNSIECNLNAVHQII